jgi:hypothetical protein
MSGFIALARIILPNSILPIDFICQAQGRVTVDPLLDAGAIRFKPILLTVIAAVTGAVVIPADPIFLGLVISLLCRARDGAPKVAIARKAAADPVPFGRWRA